MCPFSPDGTLVATGSDDKTLCITNIATQAKVYTAQCDGQVRAQAICSSFVSDHRVRCGVSRGRPTGRVLLP